MHAIGKILAAAGICAALGAASAPGEGRGAASGWGDTVTWGGRGTAEKPVATGKPGQAEFPEKAASVAPAVPRGREIPLEEGGGAAAGWLHGRLTLGAGVSRMRLTANRRPPRPETGETFVGNVTRLELEHETGWAPVATYWFARYLRASATWESIEARTFNFDRLDPHGARGQSDGVLEISGPVLMLEATWPLFGDTLFPHAGAGVFWGRSDFREDAFWNLNYANQAAYEADGKPGQAPRGVYREIRVDDAAGWVAGVGLAWRPAAHFQVDLDVRKTRVDADCEFGYNWNGHWKPQKSGDFSLDNVSWTLSAAYVF